MIDPLDTIPAARFTVEWNGTNPIYGFHVLDNETGHTYGSGLTVDHAGQIAADYERNPHAADD